MTSSFLEDRFNRMLDQLNPAQRRAVQTIEGPVWVLAGPGTGKTHILAARIGYILQQTDTQPHNILCLSFTDAGVQAMRERLTKFIGAAAHRVHIYTFHSFCNRIIQENLYRFGKRDLEPITELERLDIARQILDGLPHEHLLKVGRNSPHYFAPHLLGLFKQMKKERWKINYVQEQIARYSEMLPSLPAYQYQRKYKQYKKGDPKEAQIAHKHQTLDRIAAATALFGKYESALQQRKRYEYEDMILWVSDAFRKNPMLLRRYQEQYLYVLADEYQDTNGAQHQVLMQLIDYWDTPNVFLVGDDDQAIYEFQGARLQYTFAFQEQFSNELETIVLQDSYRSTQEILDLASALISANEIRAVHFNKHLKKDLQAALPERRKQRADIGFSVFQNRLHELSWLLDQIQKLHKQGMAYEEMAFIYARHQQAELLSQALTKYGIPFSTRREMNALDMPIIKQVLRLVQYICRETLHPYSGEALLIQLMHHPSSRIPLQEIAQLSHSVTHTHWRDIVTQVNDQQSITLSQWGQFINDAFRLQHTMSLPMYMEWLLNKSGLLTYAYNQYASAHLIEGLHAWMQFIQQQLKKDVDLNLTDLFHLVTRMRQHKLKIPIQRNTQSEKGVKLLTAHSAKGLEFEHVFIFDAIADVWDGKGRKGQHAFSLPETLTHSSEQTDTEEAQRRLFYVAMTRAKTGLDISYASVNDQHKGLQRSQFIDELLDKSEYELEDVSVTDQSVVKLQHELLQIPESRFADIKLSKDEIAMRLQDFRLSISSLNTYLRCPLSFYYEYVLNLPAATSEAAAYGQAIHATLELFVKMRLYQVSSKASSEKELTAIFESEMQKRKAFFGPSAFKHYRARGNTHLPLFFKQHLDQIPVESLLEYRISQVEYRGVPLMGTIDRIDMLPNRYAQVIDYKTGSLKLEKLRAPSSRYPQGSAYWRQLVFYKTLVELWPTYDVTVKEGLILSVDQLDDEKLQRRAYQLSSDDSSFLGTLIEQAYASIQAHAFDRACGEKNCTWCQLHEQPHFPTFLESEDTRSLDD